MKVFLLQAKLWPLHANKAISFLRSSLLHKIQGETMDRIHLGETDLKMIDHQTHGEYPRNFTYLNSFEPFNNPMKKG